MDIMLQNESPKENYNNTNSTYVSVGCVVFQLITNKLFVLLVRRQLNPFKDQWSLPGEIKPAGKTTFQVMSEALNAKTGVIVEKLHVIEQLYTFDTLGSVPTENAVTVAYMGLTRNITPLAGSKTETPQFFPIDDLPEVIAYEHRKIINYAVSRLQSKITYTNAAFGLLPKLFTFAQLQSVYETIIGSSLDKRNFRKKFMSLDLIRETDEYLREGAHRPAKLFRFNKQTLQYLSRTFE